MNTHHSASVIDPEIIDRLRSLSQVRPSAGLRVNVLEELGLADRYFRLETVAGQVYLAYNGSGISYIERVENVRNFAEEFRARFHRPAFEIDNPPQSLRSRVERVLRGKSRRAPKFDLSTVTPFEQLVLRKALEIPYGQVRSYSWVARQIGHPKAQRAVGSALAGNPIPLLIPCHRVVRSDGVIGNYGLGGPKIKRRLLQLEGANVDRLERLGRKGRRYIGSDTTHIYCFPTCSHGPRLMDEHLIEFSSVAEATTKGYRACKVCKPD